MVNLLIRADASLQTGAGHVMRCLALAHACRAQGGEAVFLSHCESQALCQRIRELGFELVSLEAPHPAPTDLRTTFSLLAQLTADQWRSAPTVIVLDGYHFDSAYQQAMQHEGQRLLVIDDTGHLPHYAADVLLNQGLLAAQMPYLLNVTTIPLLGSCYALLRPEFLVWRDWQREIPAVAHRVLVTLGGSDPHNVTRKVMLALARLAEPDLEVRVVIGPANPWRQELQQAAQGIAGRVQLLSDVRDMPRLMAWADVAIAAGGGTCWELAFMGVPTLVLVLADNQRGVVKGFSEYGLGVNLGDAAHLKSTLVAENLRALLYDQTQRARMSTVGRMVIDGNGAERVVTLLSYLAAESHGDPLRLRLATREDAGLLWQWANDPQTRVNSFHQESIPWDQHVSWYTAKLHVDETRIWILEYQHVPVGQIRYDRLAADRAQISYVVAPGWRGRGIGTQLLMRSSPLAYAELGVRRLQGITFAANSASSQAFRRAGYQVMAEELIEGRPCLVFTWMPPELRGTERVTL